MNGISKDSQATVLFRDHKTYASDIDFYYWGNKTNEYTVELSGYLMSLGYKVDHRSNILVEELIKNGNVVENGYLSAYLQMYFYMGKTVELNGDSFEKHYARDITPIARPEYYWKTSYKNIAPAIEVVGGIYGYDIPEYPGLKEYPFRLLSVTLMGLALKYNAPFTLDYEDLLDNLDSHLDKDDIDTLKNSFYYINQARNVYQLVAERRWEFLTPKIKDEVNKVLLEQSARKIEDEMVLLANKIKGIADTHFNEMGNDNVLDLIESKKQAKPLLEQSYKKVAERYKHIAKL